MEQTAETGSHAGNGQNGDSIGDIPEPGDASAHVVGDRSTQLNRNAFPSGTSAAEMGEPGAADQKRNEPERNAFCLAVGGVEDEAHALGALFSVFLVDPDHQNAGNRQKRQAPEQVVAAECADPQENAPESGGERTGHNAGGDRQTAERCGGKYGIANVAFHRQDLRKNKKADSICVKCRCHQLVSGFGIPGENIIPRIRLYLYYTVSFRICQEKIREESLP